MHPNTLGEALETAWAQWPERPALVFNGQAMSYGELAASATSLASAYASLVAPGDRIICAISNRPEHVIALAAAWLIGAVHVGVDWQFTGVELARVAEVTGAKLLLYEPPYDAENPLHTLEAVREARPGLHVALVGDRAAPPGHLSLSGLMHTRRPPAPWARRHVSFRDDPAVIFISSGTTGQPKATIGYHGNLAQRWPRLVEWLHFRPEDVHLAQMPLSHGFGLMMACSALFGGGCLALLRRFSTETALQVVDHAHVSVLNGAPAHFKMLLDRLDPARHDVSTVRLTIGTAAPFPPPLVRRIWGLGAELAIMYGSSEGIGVATADKDDILRGSVGRPAPDSVVIVGPDRRSLEPGQAGEIAFSRHVFPVRYWARSGPQPSPCPNGEPEDRRWYYSGDLGRLDHEGRLYVLGRLKHQIDRGGLKVDPVEVEAALAHCPGVGDAAVIGVHNAVLGESVCACITSLADSPPSLDEVRAALSETLAPFKLPEELCVLDEIPRTAIGKIDLPKLRMHVASAGTTKTRPDLRPPAQGSGEVSAAG